MTNKRPGKGHVRFLVRRSETLNEAPIRDGSMTAAWIDQKEGAAEWTGVGIGVARMAGQDS